MNCDHHCGGADLLNDPREVCRNELFGTVAYKPPNTSIHSFDTKTLPWVSSSQTKMPSEFLLNSWRVGLPEKSYKRECQEKDLPGGSVPILFCLGIQPNCLNVASCSESGLLQAKGFALSPRVRQSINGSPLWSHFAVVTAPIVF
jgi:hypothetical protein